MADAIKILGQVAPSATTETDLYTVPASTNTSITTLTVSSRSTTADTYRISVSSAGAATATKDYVAYDARILNNETVTFTLGLSLRYGDKIRVYASTANLSFTVFGQESTPSFIPTDLTGLLFWYDASDATTITESGGLVSQWNDRSSNTRNLTASGTTRPTTGSVTINSLNSLLFDGGDYLSSSSFSNAQPMTTFGVWQFVASTGTQVLLYGNQSSGNRILMGINSSEQTMANMGTSRTGTTVLTANNPYVFSNVINGTSSVLYVDGTQEAAATVGTNGIANGIRIGASNTPNNFIVNGGRVGEVLAYNNVLSDELRITVQNYLRAKWGTA